MTSLHTKIKRLAKEKGINGVVCRKCHKLRSLDDFGFVLRRRNINELLILAGRQNEARNMNACLYCRGYPFIKRKCSHCRELRNASYFKKISFSLDGSGVSRICVFCLDKINNDTQKVCLRCNETKTIDSFYSSQNSHLCIRCFKKTKGWEATKEYHIKYLHSPVYYDKLIEIQWCEKIRKDPFNLELGQVKCTYNECRKWFNPKWYEFTNRKKAINEGVGENSFYCSQDCKDECEKYRVNYKTMIRNDSLFAKLDREVQPELRKIVLKRDKYICVRCELEDLTGKYLHCHHKEGIRWEPLESADIDKCATVCHDCHIYIHTKIEGCSYHDLQCNLEDRLWQR